MIDSNYLIINRRAQRFAEMRIAGRLAIFTDEEGKVLDYGVVTLGDAIYAALSCDEVRNLTLVDGEESTKLDDVKKLHSVSRWSGYRHAVTTILWRDEGGYQGAKASLAPVLAGSGAGSFSEQNIRLNRYAEAIAEKLDNGVKLRVTDAVDESDMAVCPECGMLNPAGSPYCLDCGAEIL